MAMAVSIRVGSISSDPPEGARAVEVRRLDWETEFFGAQMGALVVAGSADGSELLGQSDALARVLRSALRDAELDGYRHLSLRISADDLPAIWAAERAGLRLMDIAVDLVYRFGAAESPTPLREVRQATPADAPAMRAMTAGAFGLTRFAVDPFFAAWQVDEFYATWATNLFNGLADHVVVADVDGRPAGFVSCKRLSNGDGRIPLVATSRAFRRQGIARDLLAAALAWFRGAGCTTVYVKTQVANAPAVALYERASFTLDHTELTFTTTQN